MLEINLLLRFELMRVNEEPVSNNAESLKFLMVTVEMGLAGGVIVKQFDNTAQKLMTAAGKGVSYFPFSLVVSRDPQVLLILFFIFRVL